MILTNYFPFTLCLIFSLCNSLVISFSRDAQLSPVNHILDENRILDKTREILDETPKMTKNQPQVPIAKKKHESALPIRIITHNIRYATTHPFPGESPWPTRSPHLISELRFHTLYSPTSFICLQEVLSSQLADILYGLNCPSTTAHRSGKDEEREWSYIGVGRDDGSTQGEYSPILFRPSVWELQWWTTKWLSPTPDVPSRGWDAASTRIVTIGLLSHRETGRRVLALNTHMDDQGSVARYEGAKLIARLIREYLDEFGSRETEDGSVDVFLAGDLNSRPEEEAYGFLNGADSPVRDLRGLVPEDQCYGHWNTFTGFDDGAEEPKKRIDFVFLGKNGRWKPAMYGVLANRFRGVWNSDHRAVVADAVLECGC